MAPGMFSFPEKSSPTTQLSATNSALVNVKDKSGKYIYAGRNLTGFSNEEEDAVEKTKYVPFKLEDRVRNVPAFGIQVINRSFFACLCSWPNWARTSVAPLGAPGLLSMEISLPVKTLPVRRESERPSSRLSRKCLDKCFSMNSKISPVSRGMRNRILPCSSFIESNALVISL